MFGIHGTQENLLVMRRILNATLWNNFKNKMVGKKY